MKNNEALNHKAMHPEEMHNKPTANGNTLPAHHNAENASAATDLSNLPPEVAIEVFLQNPAAFVQAIVDSAAKTHLADLKEEAELQGAINAFRKLHPEFDRFESFILQEVASLIQNDPDGVIDPWPKLLEKGFLQFQQKFKETIQQRPIEIEDKASNPPHVENANNRTLPEVPPVYTRSQIAKMSMADFLKNEAAINAALQDKRIR